MSEQESTGVFDWTKHCWARVYASPTAHPLCGKLAKWRGPRETSNEVWRACDEHHLPSDIPLEEGGQS